MEDAPAQARMGRVQYALRLSVLLVRYLFGQAADFVAARARVMLRERDLFLGSGLLLIGLLNFNVGRYCDGNTGDYLSCTRPAVYYSFDALDITLIVLGVFSLLFWHLKRSAR